MRDEIKKYILDEFRGKIRESLARTSHPDVDFKRSNRGGAQKVGSNMEYFGVRSISLMVPTSFD